MLARGGLAILALMVIINSRTSNDARIGIILASG
jgi:hypothetical protein